MDMRIVAPLALTGLAVAAVFGFNVLNGSGPSAPPQAVEPSAAESAAPVAQAALTPERIKEIASRIDGQRIIAADSEPGNWLAHGRTYGEQRFSPLDQINLESVSRLGLAWSFDTGTTHGLEASPIVVDGVAFTTGSYSIVYALNAKTGELIWEYDPGVPRDWSRRTCCDVVNRGVAVWKGNVYVGTIDGRLEALDAATGKVLWSVVTVDQSKSYSITGAPRMVKDKVIIGNGGAELGVRGYFSAYDASTGALAWRFYTVPRDPALGPDGAASDAAIAKAQETWLGDVAWEAGGGGTAWDAFVYDPDLDLLYVGTGNGSPWNRKVRSPGGGDNLYLSSILAVRPDTGELVWHYQTTPGDTWDYTATQPLMLADLEIAGASRKVIMQAPKNGFFYVLDRATGELISAEKYSVVDWALGIDKATGRPIENPDMHFWDAPKMITPGPTGAHNWQPMAFSPQTNLVYVPTKINPGLYLHEADFKFRPLAWNLGIDLAGYADVLESMPLPPPSKGFLTAWDPVNQRLAWQVEMQNFWNAGVLATAGGLVFQGTGDGRLVAYNAKTGDVVWDAPVLTGMIAPPVSYMVDGEQYLAIMVGWGGVGVPSGDPRTSAAVKYGNAGRMLAFKLDGAMKLPVLAERDLTIPEQPMIKTTAEAVRSGSQLFMARCSFCHGALAASPGVVPDLRMMAPGTHEAFNDIVLKGTRAAQGMPGFGDLLSEADADAIHAYVVHRANLARSEQGG